MPWLVSPGEQGEELGSCRSFRPPAFEVVKSRGLVVEMPTLETFALALLRVTTAGSERWRGRASSGHVCGAQGGPLEAP